MLNELKELARKADAQGMDLKYYCKHTGVLVPVNWDLLIETPVLMTECTLIKFLQIQTVYQKEEKIQG